MKYIQFTPARATFRYRYVYAAVSVEVFLEELLSGAVKDKNKSLKILVVPHSI